jgi:hypothetical protein
VKAGNHQPAEQLHDGKLEKSYLNYCQHYPNTEIGHSAVPFVDRFDTYKSMM